MDLQEPSERPFDLAAVPKDVKPLPQVEKKAPTRSEKKAAKDAHQKADSGASNTFEAYEKLLNSIPQFAGFGKLFKVLQPALCVLSSMEDKVTMMKAVIYSFSQIFIVHHWLFYLLVESIACVSCLRV